MAKSTTLFGDAAASATVATVVVLCIVDDDDEDCILSKFPTKLKRSVVVSVSKRYDDEDGSDDGLFSVVGGCCKFSKFSFRLFDRRTIVREP